MDDYRFCQFHHQVDGIQGRKPLRIKSESIFDLQAIGNLVSHMYSGHMKPTFSSPFSGP
jgi:hypothetical protein